MTGLMLVVVAVVAFILYAYFHSIDPKSKTDDQLRLLYGKHLRSGGLREQELDSIESEMRRRGLLSNSDSPARPLTNESHISQLQANRLRQEALKSYREGWEMAAGKWESEPLKRHRHALANVLLRRLQQEQSALQIDEQIIETLNFEAMPFGNIDFENGKDAIAEYMVWREYPDLANREPILRAIENLKSKGFISEVLGDGGAESIGWVPWSKLL